MEKSELKELIFIVFDNLMEQNSTIKIEKSLNTKLIGETSPFDSLGLVNFLLMIEENVSTKLGMDIQIADYEIISAKNSPLETVDVFIDFLKNKINEKS